MELTSIVRGVALTTVVLGSLVGFAPDAGAQGTGTATECAAGAGAMYQRCALWMDGRRVRGGADGAARAANRAIFWHNSNFGR